MSLPISIFVDIYLLRLAEFRCALRTAYPTRTRCAHGRRMVKIQMCMMRVPSSRIEDCSMEGVPRRIDWVIFLLQRLLAGSCDTFVRTGESRCGSRCGGSAGVVVRLGHVVVVCEVCVVWLRCCDSR